MLLTLLFIWEWAGLGVTSIKSNQPNSVFASTPVFTKGKRTPTCFVPTAFFPFRSEFERRVRLVIEGIFSNDKVLLGLRFTFIILDPQFNCDSALENLFFLTKRAIEGGEKHVIDPMLNVCENKTDWIGGLNLYSDDEFHSEQNWRAANAYTLSSSGNPSQVLKVFTINRTIENDEDTSQH